MKKFVAAILAASMLAGTLTACSGGQTVSESQSAPEQSESTGAAEGGTRFLNIQNETGVDSLDPQIATDARSHELLGTFLEGLCTIDADGNVVPALAESYEVSEDGLTYTFHLRDALWSNGDPVTANDFVFAWQRALSTDVASEYAFMLYEVAQLKNSQAIADGEMDPSELGVRAEDDKTLVAELENPVVFFPSLTAFPTFFPVNEAFYDSCNGSFATSPDTLLSCGPYIVTEFDPAATTYRVEKNDQYWDAENVSLAGISFQVISDNQTSLLSFQNGEMDVVRIGGEQVELVRDDPAFSVLPFAGYLWYLSLNMEGVETLDNLNMRKAIYYAIDRDLLANNVLADGSDPATYLVPTNLANGPDGQDYRATGPEYEGGDEAKATEAYNLACQELGQNEFSFEMTIEDTDTCAKVAAFLQDQIQTKLPGVTISIRTVSRKQLNDDMRAGEYNIGLTRWGADYLDPMTFLALWKTGASNNFGGWSNAEYDAILDDCTTGTLATDAQGRWDALHDAEQIAMNDCEVIPLYETHSCVLQNPNVTGLTFQPYGILRNYKYVTINE